MDFALVSSGNALLLVGKQTRPGNSVSVRYAADFRQPGVFVIELVLALIWIPNEFLCTFGLPWKFKLDRFF